MLDFWSLFSDLRVQGPSFAVYYLGVNLLGVYELDSTPHHSVDYIPCTLLCPVDFTWSSCCKDAKYNI